MTETPAPRALVPMTEEDAVTMGRWRLPPETRRGLRTPVLLTEAHQRRWFRDVLENPASPHRYWSVVRISDVYYPDHGAFRHGERLLDAVVALTSIQWENGWAEVALITDPNQTGQGIGREALRLVLDEAFDRLRLLTVWGECYHCNEPALGFWRTMVLDWGEPDRTVLLPRRKWWDGRLWDADGFIFTREFWRRKFPVPSKSRIFMEGFEPAESDGAAHS